MTQLAQRLTNETECELMAQHTSIRRALRYALFAQWLVDSSDADYTAFRKRHLDTTRLNADLCTVAADASRVPNVLQTELKKIGATTSWTGVLCDAWKLESSGKRADVQVDGRSALRTVIEESCSRFKEAVTVYDGMLDTGGYSSESAYSSDTASHTSDGDDDDDADDEYVSK